MNDDYSTALTVKRPEAVTLNKSGKVTAIVKGKAASADYVPHIGITEIRAIADAAGNTGRHRERDRLLVLTLADGCLRVSECLRLRPRDIKHSDSGWYVEVFGKGSKPGVAAISSSLAAQLQACCYRCGIGVNDPIFPINRSRAFQIVERAMQNAGVSKPDHVGTIHVLRHSGALERLRLTGNPRSVQEQLRHSTVQMTLRYLKTLSAEESLQIQQQIDFQW